MVGIQAKPTEKVNKRQVILEAAQALITERGLEGFRVREIAARADLHHATMLHYFPNREALLRGVLKNIVETFDQVPGDLAGNLSPIEVLHAHFQHILQQMQLAPARFIVLNELFLKAERDESIKALLEITDQDWYGFLYPILQAGIQQGCFRQDVTPEGLATLITSTFKGLSLQLNAYASEGAEAVRQLELLILAPESTSPC